MRTAFSRVLLVATLASGLAACGDAPTTDNRGYTKAPLERANVIIKPEGSSAMDSLGTPILPKDTLIPAEPAAPAPAAPATGQ